MNTVLTIISGLVALGFTGWLGMQVPPKIEPVQSETYPAEYITNIPDNLPVPVQSYYSVVFTDKIPVVRTAVFSGKPRARINGIKMRINY